MVRQSYSRLKRALSRRTEGPPPNAGDITLVAIFKNELDYVIEWLAYHRSVGFRSFIIGDNNSDDGTSELLEALDDGGVIERRHAPDLPDTPTQVAFYNAVVDSLLAGPDRLLGFIDADEFVMAAQPGDVADRVAAAFRDPGVGAMGLNWKIYGSSGFVRESIGPVLLRFSAHADPSFEKNRFIKSFVRLSRVERMDVHNAVLSGGRTVNGAGAPLEYERAGWRHRSRDVDWSDLFVGHYIVKSRAEHERKKAGKGSATKGARIRKGPGYIRAHDRSDRFEAAPATLLHGVFAEQERLLLRLRSHSRYFLPCRGGAAFDPATGEVSGWVSCPQDMPAPVRIIARCAGLERVVTTTPADSGADGRSADEEGRHRFQLSLADFGDCEAADLELRPYGSCVAITIESDAS